MLNYNVLTDLTPIHPIKQAKIRPIKESEISTTISMTFRSQTYRLRGTLHLPDALRPPVVIGSHGLFGTSASAKQVALAAACTAAGIGYLRFDHRGCGDSEGDFARVTTLPGRVQDLLDAAGEIEKRTDTGDALGFFGSSLGGAVCISAAGDLKPAALVICAAPVRSGEIDPARAVPEDGPAEPPHPSGLRFDLAGPAAGVRNVLLFHGDADEVVPYRHAQEICAAAAEPKELVTLTGGDHRMTDAAHQALFVAETIGWFRARLPVSGEFRPQPSS